MLYNIVVVLYCDILKCKEVIYLRELFVEKVIDKTENFLNKNQRKMLKEILTEICLNYQIEILEQNQREEIQHNNEELLNKFISSKEIEGCSNRTLNYYKDNITKMLKKINLPIEEITTEILRDYLADYKNNSKAGMVTIDNIRRTLSSFFAWLENEDYIVKSPVRRIHKVKTTKRVKETLCKVLYITTLHSNSKIIALTNARRDIEQLLRYRRIQKQSITAFLLLLLCRIWLRLQHKPIQRLLFLKLKRLYRPAAI